MPVKLLLIVIGLALLLPTLAVAFNDHLLLDTDRGEILIQLNFARAPLTAENVMSLAEAGHYDGLIFHRVIEDFVIQTGGYDPDMEERRSEEQIPNESGNGLSNERGTVALARGSDPHSGSAQFYINLSDNSRLDPRSTRWGYAVFGRVRAGMSVADEIAGLPTGGRAHLSSDVPEEDVRIRRARPMSYEEAEAWLQDRNNASDEED